MSTTKAVQNPLGPLIAQRLKEAMAAHPTVKSQAALEATSGVRQSSICRILQGDTDPGANTLYALANGLGLPLTALLSEVPIVPSKFLRRQDLALAHLNPLPRAFIDIVLKVLETNGLDDADCAKLIGEWGQRLKANPTASQPGALPG